MIMEPQRRLPDWLKVPMPGGPNYMRLKGLLRSSELHTICEEAHCPNIGECFENGTATFLILGDICTRRCHYCAVTTGRPKPPDLLEPDRVAKTVQTLALRHAVITSPNRDDLPDGGASIYAATIRRIRQLIPACRVEVLISDFMGSWDALAKVMAAAPDILNHNIETVPRVFHSVRPKGDYRRSLELLAKAKEMVPQGITKSGMMVGLGEEHEEILGVMDDLRSVGCDVMTIGQYLRPSLKHHAVMKFYTPEEFRELKAEGLRRGFRHVESGPLVRSSYHAHQQVPVAVS